MNNDIRLVRLNLNSKQYSSDPRKTTEVSLTEKKSMEVVNAEIGKQEDKLTRLSISRNNFTNPMGNPTEQVDCGKEQTMCTDAVPTYDCYGTWKDVAFHDYCDNGKYMGVRMHYNDD